ncbi:hypothetical protein SISNIDRAFT_412745 [Sistotremastrum niveocremeum HHB9708]|uniref:Autophagy-related protein 14 n=2 Tax=Sistotremastraceae TaxID=3402574 RepID=A0A164TI59_9AGAM|nr:hypothetical protein SISNIDRAFT_412745 [Sistotremastrum niveocremeum HHB9708]KZT41297.1 hypothetical protein SISSUDRAFT_1069961 [Sistotremastrum suecicum HHB10207 ss-3]
MECRNCELTKFKFYCENCLRNHQRDYRNANDYVSTEKSQHIEKASRALERMEPARKRRAEVASLEKSVAELQEQLGRLREANDQTRQRLAQLQAGLGTRRQSLKQAEQFVPQTQKHPSVETLRRASLDMTSALARARSGLVQELVEVFHVVEVGGRPSWGRIVGAKGQWSIAGSELPVPGDINRHQPEQINATVQHTIHFLSLLTFYLGVKLPFEITWNGNAPTVGQAFISATKGGESGGWAKWPGKYPLHLPTPSSSFSSSSSSSTSAKEAQQNFITGFTMLLYNVAYLAHTQGIEVTLAQSGEVLRNLWAVCCSTELGKRSHNSGAHLLSPPTPPSFSLDFSQLLQATTTNPPSRSQARKLAAAAQKSDLKKRETAIAEEDWHLVESSEDLGGVG